MSCSNFTNTLILISVFHVKNKIKRKTAKYMHCSFLFKMQMVKLRIEIKDRIKHSFFKSSLWEDVKVLKGIGVCL